MLTETLDTKNKEGWTEKNRWILCVRRPIIFRQFILRSQTIFEEDVARHRIKKYLSQSGKIAFCFCFYTENQSLRRNYNLSEVHINLMLAIMTNMAIPGNHMLLIICISVAVVVCSFMLNHYPYTKVISLNI